VGAGGWVGGGRPTGGRQLAARLRAAARRVPRAAWACGAVAWLSAASWSVVSAPLQVPDEPSHFAYVQGLAEHGTLPRSSSVEYAPEEMVALRDLAHNEVRYNALHGTISTPAQQQRLERDLAGPPPGPGEGAGVAWSQPPLYYALQTIPYHLAGALGGNLLARLALMRLASALLAGLTAIFAYLFLREALPGAPWAWAVGGLAVALFPLVGFMSGAVNPDAGLSAVAAALFYCVARAFRRGLTLRLAVAIGVVTAVGLVTKLNFIGLVPGLAMALALLAWRERSRGRAALRSPAVAAAIGASPVCVYAVVNLLSNHPTLGLTSSAATAVSRNGLLGELSYIWQFYLPRLPGMAHDFPGLLSTRLWFDRSVGLYGWLDTPFPQWVYNAATLPAAAILALCAAALLSARAELRRRAPELLAYAAMALGLVALIGVDSFLEYPGRAGGYTEPRYLLPLTALFGAVFALAARGAGRRWGPAVGAALVVLVLGHDVFSQLLTVARYYG
jgi:4-amino-4-deoxy-L-arabinose transferase-like glycosyltransferase